MISWESFLYIFSFFLIHSIAVFTVCVLIHVLYFMKIYRTVVKKKSEKLIVIPVWCPICFRVTLTRTETSGKFSFLVLLLLFCDIFCLLSDSFFVSFQFLHNCVLLFVAGKNLMPFRTTNSTLV